MSEPGGNLDRALNTELLCARIIVRFFATVAVLNLGFFTVLRETGGKPPSQPMMGIVGVALATAALGAAAVIPNVMARGLQRVFARSSRPSPPLQLRWVGKLTADEGAVLGWWGVYEVNLTLRCAFLLGAALFQARAFLFEGNLFSIGVGLALLAVLLYQWPNRERVNRWVEARREAVERLQRGESP
jgi:hypothetical protein